jgi:phage baseplate assembly protein W
MAKEFKFSDFRSQFYPHPNTGDITVVYDEISIGQAIKNLLLTKKYDRLFQPEINSTIHKMLFEPVSDVIADIIEDRVEIVIKNFEPRADVIDIRVVAEEDNNRYSVTVTYKIKSAVENVKATFFLERIV